MPWAALKSQLGHLLDQQSQAGQWLLWIVALTNMRGIRMVPYPQSLTRLEHFKNYRGLQPGLTCHKGILYMYLFLFKRKTHSIHIICLIVALND